MSTDNNDTLKERLIMVEQQQSHHKEVLVEINETLREVVKTQHILANQRKDIDRLSKENEQMLLKVHNYDIREAQRNTNEEHQTMLVESMHKAMKEEIIPQQQKTKTYFRLMGIIVAAVWGLSVAFVKQNLT